MLEEEKSSESTSVEREDAVRKRVTSAATFVAVGIAGSNVLRVLANLVLARMLVPADFGVMALISTVLMALGLFSDFGIKASIVHNRRGREPAFQDTAWCFEVGRGLLLCLICTAGAWPVAEFYAAPELRYILPVSGLTALFSGFHSTRIAIYQRELRNKDIEIMNLACYAASIVVMLVWAFIHPTVWALAAGGVSHMLLVLIWSHTALKGHRNRLRWNSDCAREILSFGSWIFISTAATFLAERADNLFLGKLITIAQLGVFGFAVAISSIPSMLAAQLSGKVVFPLFSRYAAEGGDQLGQKIRNARGIMLPAFVLLSLGAAVTCDPFFRYLYPVEYHDAAWICQWLSFAVFFNIMKTSADRAFLAIGNSRALAISTLLGGIVRLGVAVPACMQFGIEGFIGGVIFGAIVSQWVTVLLLWRNGIRTVYQDLRYTGIGVVSATTALGLPIWIAAQLQLPLEATRYATAVPVLAVLGLWSLKRLRMGMRATADD